MASDTNFSTVSPTTSTGSLKEPIRWLASIAPKLELIGGTFAKRILPQGAQLVVEHILLKDDQAVVELRSLATAENGLRFDTRHCWVVRFCGKTIVQVRAYLDSAMIAHLFDESLPTSDRTAGPLQSGMKLVGSICSSRT